MTQTEIINSFERGLLSAHGDEIRVTGAVRISEPAEIRQMMRQNGYEPVGHPAKYNNGEHLPERFRPISAKKRELIEATLAGMDRPGGFAPSFREAWDLVDQA